MADHSFSSIKTLHTQQQYGRGRFDLLFLVMYGLILLAMVLHVPKMVDLYDTQRAAMISFGFIGFWRYGWWLNHIIRSCLYRYILFPKRRAAANQLWVDGWRPKRLFFMMTTFQEVKSTTERVLQSILDECAKISVPVKLFIGTGADSDEAIIEDFFSKQTTLSSFDVVMIRQKRRGKRYAIGETMRAIVRHGLTPEDLVVFMDGDTFFEPGCLSLCLPFFELDPSMQALTTHEKVIVVQGPSWVRKWLEMRFAQRDFTMQSHAVSNKVLTLTGRMSVFRGKHLCEPAFIDIIEQDHLKHWLWGDYRFLSGDDKSTWYYLLKSGANMCYIPDAVTVTLEYIDGNGLDRMKENLRRWSGNTLRNGARAIRLGPKKTGFFIWCCLIDQRCAIWTMLFGHMMIITLAVTSGSLFLWLAFLRIAVSRLFISLILFIHARRIDMSFPFLVYINQLVTMFIKIYIIFRLPQQRWKNRGDQHAGYVIPKGSKIKTSVATYLTIFYCTCCFLLMLRCLNLVCLPSLGDMKALIQ